MSGVSREALARQRKEIDALRGRFPGLTLLHGSELNIGRDGSVDYDPEFRRTLEWRVAGVHSHFDLDRDEQTRRILAAMEDPTVDAIAHLSGRRIGRRAGIDLDVDAVLAKAAATNTAIEINAVARPARRVERGAAARPRAGRDVRAQHGHPPHARARADGLGRAACDARLGRPVADRELLAAREVPGMAAGAPELRTASAAYRVFLLSPADCSGRRARLLRKPDPGHDLGRRLQGDAGAAVGEVFAFVSSLYFRGKLAYARAFARPPAGRRRHPRDHAVRRARLARGAAPRRATSSGTDACRSTSREPRYRRPLVRHLEALAPTLGRDRGGAAGKRRVAQVRPAADGGARGSRRLPVGLRGRGDMSRGGLMLRCVDEGRELRVRPARGRRAPRAAAGAAASREGEDSEVG